MLDGLLKFFGVTAHGADKIVRVQPAWHLPFPPIVLVLLIVAIVAGVALVYRREEGDVSRVRRVAMAACRMVFLVLLLAILLRPVLAVTVGTEVRETMVVLVDTSASMKIADVREQDDDRRRAAIAIGQLDPKAGMTHGALPGMPAVPRPRIDLVKAALANDKIDLLARLRKKFDLAIYTFDGRASEVPTGSGSELAWIDGLKAQGQSTALGDALRDVLSARRGQALGGVLVVTDGANNSGASLAGAGALAKSDQVPLYAYGVGITAPRDIVVSSILGPDVAFVNDDLPLTVRIRSQGFAGDRGMLVLTQDGTRVGEQEVTFGQEGEQTVPIKFMPRTVGDFTLSASIAPRDEEIVKDNNTSSPKHLRVIDGRIKVLQIEQSPRWEFKYLQAMLMRDRRVDYHCWLLDADPGVTAENSSGKSPYLSGFPQQKEDLLKYDLVILGDVDPKKLPPGAMEQLNSFVSTFGGGFIMIAGSRAAPQSYRQTPIEQMLPVELDLSSAAALIGQPGDRPIRLELTPAGKAAQVMKLAAVEADSQRLWEQLPPIYWDARVARAKPAADVLLVDADPGKATRFGKMPVIALQQYGLGQVLFVGTDNTWRWRKNQGDEIFNRVWSQLVERMALAHMLGLAKRTQLTMDKDRYAAGDRVTVYARLYREKTFEPLTEPTLKGTYTLKADSGTNPGGTASGPGTPHEVLLRALQDQPGMYRAEFLAPEPGTYEFKVETDTQTGIDFLVAPSNIELAETAMNEAGLRTLAADGGSGGAFVREENLYKLPDLMRHTAEPLLSNYEVDIWSSPACFAAVLLVVAIEWFLRKRAQLK